MDQLDHSILSILIYLAGFDLIESRSKHFACISGVNLEHHYVEEERQKTETHAIFEDKDEVSPFVGYESIVGWYMFVTLPFLWYE